MSGYYGSKLHEANKARQEAKEQRCRDLARDIVIEQIRRGDALQANDPEAVNAEAKLYYVITRLEELICLLANKLPSDSSETLRNGYWAPKPQPSALSPEKPEVK